MSTNNSPKASDSKKVEDAINEYYDLKQQYTISKDTEKQKFLETNEKLSWREKRNLFKSLNYKCVNCKRYVGSTFNTIIKEEDRHLIAKCGDKSNPCPLKIEINLGTILSYNKALNIFQEQILNNKQDIVKDKNNLLFGYISSKEAVTKFDKIKDDLSSNIEQYEENNKKYLSITNNLAQKEQTLLLQQQIYEIINTIKLFITQYESSNNPVLVDDAVKLYTEDLINKIKEINVLSFAYKEVEYNSDLNTYTLIEKQYSVEQMEIPIGLEPAVLSFITGLGNEPINGINKEGINKEGINKKGKKTKAKTKAQLAAEEEILDKLPDKFGPNVSPNVKKTRAPRKMDNPVKNKTIKRATKKVVAFEIEPGSDSDITVELPAPNAIANHDKNIDSDNTVELPTKPSDTATATATATATKEVTIKDIDWGDSTDSDKTIEVEENNTGKGMEKGLDFNQPIIDLDMIELPNYVSDNFEIENQESISEKSQKNLFE